MDDGRRFDPIKGAQGQRPENLDDLAARLDVYNQAYREGNPIVSDAQYDVLVEKLRELAPDHPYLQIVEPEKFADRQKVRHPTPMLSIEKAYTIEQLERFVARVEKEAAVVGIETVTFRLTPKLDGLAGRDEGGVFATRGNGEVGYEISSAFTKGVVPIGGRGQGVGEIVAVKSYFDAHMGNFFEHPRNMVVGIIASDTLNENAAGSIERPAWSISYPTTRSKRSL
jgi:DNA ligase (NAD+)